MCFFYGWVPQESKNKLNARFVPLAAEFTSNLIAPGEDDASRKRRKL